MDTLYVNGHFLHQRLTGVQRYAREVLAGFDEAGYPYRLLSPPPKIAASKVGQHFWEQVMLPFKPMDRAVLWSPTNTGPMYMNNHVITLHDAAVFVHPEWFSTAYVRWRTLLLPRIIRRAKTVLTVSEYSKGVICRHLNISPRQVKVVYNGIDTKRFQPADQASIERVRSKYALSGPYLLSLGSLDPRKNFGRLVDAWHHHTQQNPGEYTLAIAGGSNRNFSAFRLNGSDSVKLLGYVDDADLPALYSGATAFLFPSLFEGFGLPVLESMACGTPVLTSNTTALDEIAGDAALKVAPENVRAIADGISQLLASNKLRQDLIGRGFERIKAFDWNHAAAAIYKHLMQ